MMCSTFLGSVSKMKTTPAVTPCVWINLIRETLSQNLIIDGPLGFPSTTEIQLPVVVDKRMVDDEQSVLDVKTPACTLVVIIEIDHLRWVLKDVTNVIAHFARDDRTLYVESEGIVNPDVPLLVLLVRVLLNIRVYIE